MKIAISSEVSGYPLKEAVKKFLISKGYEIIDVGFNEGEPPINYVEAGKRLAPLIGECEKGLIFCGSAAGVGVTMNKFKGIYCVISESLYTAPRASIILNANVLAVGSKVVAEDNACQMCEEFLKESFCNNFDADRAEVVRSMFSELQTLENDNFK